MGYLLLRLVGLSDQPGGAHAKTEPGTIPHGYSGLSRPTGEWAAGDVDGALVHPAGDRWATGAHRPRMGAARRAVRMGRAEALLCPSATPRGDAADRCGASLARPLRPSWGAHHQAPGAERSDRWGGVGHDAWRGRLTQEAGRERGARIGLDREPAGGRAGVDRAAVASLFWTKSNPIRDAVGFVCSRRPQASRLLRGGFR